MCYIYHGEVLLYHGEVSFFYHGFNGFNGLDGFLSCGCRKQDKNRENPLERMEGDALLLCFRPGLIRASS